MRMKRKDTQLLVENWRSLLKGEPIAGEPTNEVFFGKRVLNLLKDKIDSKLKELKAQIGASKQKINNPPGSIHQHELLKLVIETNFDKIVDGQVLMYLKSCMPSESEVDYDKSNKVKQKVFENIFNDIVSGRVELGSIKTIRERAVEVFRPQNKNPENEFIINDNNYERMKGHKNFEIPIEVNVQKIKNIGKEVANLCNKR